MAKLAEERENAASDQIMRDEEHGMLEQARKNVFLSMNCGSSEPFEARMPNFARKFL